MNNQVEVELWDEDYGADDSIGRGTFNISDAMDNKNDQFQVQLRHKGSESGTCNFMVVFT